MPIHDWTRVDAGIFHDFHHAWIEELKRALNRGLLPPDHYALAEQYAGEREPDVLTLQVPTDGSNGAPMVTSGEGGVAVETAPPKVSFHTRANIDNYADKANVIAIRHLSGHRVVAMIELVSPGNKSESLASKETTGHDRTEQIL